MNFIHEYLEETIHIIKFSLLNNKCEIEKLINELVDLRSRKGRLFILGVGGSAANASHAVNDFRKICGIEAYAPTDNVAELTARTNDEGWNSVFEEYFKVSNLNSNDDILIFSVGGGNKDKNISENLIWAIEYAKNHNVKVFGIVGRDGGYTARYADVSVVITPYFSDRITPHTEELQAVLWHLLVSHPKLQINKTKWESDKK